MPCKKADADRHQTVDPHPQAETTGAGSAIPKACCSTSWSRPRFRRRQESSRNRCRAARRGGGSRALEGRKGASAAAVARAALQLRCCAFASISCRRAGAAPVRSFRRRHRVPARRAFERPSHARVRQVGRPRTPSFELGRRNLRRCRPRHAADDRPRPHVRLGCRPARARVELFHYVRDPWGSFAEYSYDIDFIPADLEWRAKDHPPEDSFYLWGPRRPITSSEPRDRNAARRVASRDRSTDNKRQGGGR